MNKSGFTLIELIIVIMIIGVVAGMVGFIMLTTVDAWTLKFNRSDMLWDGRLALNRMVREIREADSDDSVTTASSSQFRFTDEDGVDITYSLSSTDLNRTADATANMLAENVSSLAFTYFSSCASDATSITPTVGTDTNIRRVRINLTLTTGGEDVYLQADSVPRNF